MESWKIRVVDERNSLQEKIHKLESYKEGSAFKLLDQVDQNLLQEQWMAMVDYLDILNLRISRF